MAGVCLTARAQVTPPPPLPPLDLGQTNLLDGEGGPGAVLETIGFGSIANRLVDSNGDSVLGRNHQRVAALVLHPVWTSSATLVGAHPGVEVLVPFSRVDNDFDAGGSGLRSGFGDITVAPFLQWSSKHAAGAVSARLALQVVAPTGSHREADAVNVGQGAFQLSPYLAATWRVSEKWEVSGRAIYEWSGSASQQRASGERLRVQAGDLVAVNASASYALSQALRLGIAGYALQQLSDGRVDGREIADRRERVFALGPAVQWTYKHAVVRVAAYREFGVRNRPESTTFNARLAWPF